MSCELVWQDDAFGGSIACGSNITYKIVKSDGRFEKYIIEYYIDNSNTAHSLGLPNHESYIETLACAKAVVQQYYTYRYENHVAIKGCATIMADAEMRVIKIMDADGLHLPHDKKRKELYQKYYEKYADRELFATY